MTGVWSPTWKVSAPEGGVTPSVKRGYAKLSSKTVKGGEPPCVVSVKAVVNFQKD